MSYLTKQVITNADGSTVETEPQEVAQDAGYITYDSNTATLTLGKNGDPSKVTIDNDSMDIVVDDHRIASFSGAASGSVSRCSIDTENTETALCGMESSKNGEDYLQAGIRAYSREDWIQKSWASVSCHVSSGQPSVLLNAADESGSGSFSLTKTGVQITGSLFVSDAATTRTNLGLSPASITGSMTFYGYITGSSKSVQLYVPITAVGATAFWANGTMSYTIRGGSGATLTGTIAASSLEGLGFANGGAALAMRITLPSAFGGGNNVAVSGFFSGVTFTFAY